MSNCALMSRQPDVVILIAGAMTYCPAYLGVKVTERMAGQTSELLRYDMLVLCPAQFNLTVDIPDIDDDWTTPHLPRTFHLQLDDLSTTQHLFLTHVSTCCCCDY